MLGGLLMGLLEDALGSEAAMGQDIVLAGRYKKLERCWRQLSNHWCSMKCKILEANKFLQKYLDSNTIDIGTQLSSDVFGEEIVDYLTSKGVRGVVELGYGSINNDEYSSLMYYARQYVDITNDIKGLHELVDETESAYVMLGFDFSLWQPFKSEIENRLKGIELALQTYAPECIDKGFEINVVAVGLTEDVYTIPGGVYANGIDDCFVLVGSEKCIVIDYDDALCKDITADNIYDLLDEYEFSVYEKEALSVGVSDKSNILLLPGIEIDIEEIDSRIEEKECMGNMDYIGLTLSNPF